MSSQPNDISLLIKKRSTLREAMLRLEQTSKKCLFVVSDLEKIVGALTDGDVRRAILAGCNLDDAIEGHFNVTPFVVQDREGAENKALEIMKIHKIEVVPIVDGNGRMVRHLTWEGLFAEHARAPKPLLDVPVVIMAGGFGTRLEPFTKILPKPLIPVNGKPIIEHIIDRFVENGVKDFWLTVNYKSRILKSYFQDQESDYSVHFVDEPEPMGTAGSLQFLKNDFHTPFFVTNCDSIITSDYRTILDFHTTNEHALTLVGSTVHYEIPYGTCVLNDAGSLAKINEKPAYDFLVNTGTYVLNPSVLELIPTAGKFHMTDLIETVLAQELTVGVFPISEGAWIDVGQWKEYKNALDRL
jgi:dTDP-glucose pyrophosphorylase